MGSIRRQPSTQVLTVVGKYIDLQSKRTKYEGFKHRVPLNFMEESPSVVDKNIELSDWWSMLQVLLPLSLTAYRTGALAPYLGAIDYGHDCASYCSFFGTDN